MQFEANVRAIPITILLFHGALIALVAPALPEVVLQRSDRRLHDAAQLGEEFLPHFKEYDFLMHWVEKPGTSLDAMNRITIRASKELRAIPGVRNFGAHVGRAEVAGDRGGGEL